MAAHAVTDTPETVLEDSAALRAEIGALHSELELLHDALERMPHGMCAFDNQDRLVLANADFVVADLIAGRFTRSATPRQVPLPIDDSPCAPLAELELAAACGALSASFC